MFIRMLFFLGENVLHEPLGRGVLVAEELNDFAVRLDRDPLGDEVSRIMSASGSPFLVFAVAAARQRRRIHLGLAAQLA